MIVAVGIIFWTRAVFAASDLATYLPKIHHGDFFTGADRFGPAQGDPPIVPVYRGDQLQGFVYLNSDFANSIGYSGKPIHILVGIDTDGIVRGLRLVDHKEPIVLIGIPEPRIVAAINSLIGKDMKPIAQGAERPPQVDIVSGATVTVLVMGDSIVRSAVRLIRTGRIGGGSAAAAALPPVTKTLDLGKSEIRDWASLVGDGSVRRLHLTIGEVNEAFAKSGNAAAAQNPETGAAGDTFIDLYVALASAPTIGRSLLGDDGYERLKERLQPGQQAIMIAGEGLYSFKGSAYVRGGIFDRVEILQEGSSTRFRDRNHIRLGALAADGAPDLHEIGLFVTPPEFTLDPVQPWELQLLVQRNVGSRDKAFLTFDLDYNLPDRYLRSEQRAVTVPSSAPAARTSAPGAQVSLPADDGEEPLWMRIWRSQPASIAITAMALIVLTTIFFFQNVLVRRPTLYTWVRRGYLAFVLIWLGWYANAQLSVVNVVTFTSALVTGLHWEFFLAAPLIFILWSATAAALLFWGRGPFCGWLCPFGALQELTNTVAKSLKVPQITVPWGLHERLWPIKYIIFLAVFGLSLYSVALAETFAEVEPFKTAIILKFARGWPFVAYAGALLFIGLFIERFFCRYLCPLGAALAIPGRIRTFEWLRRWKECGSPCQRCAKDCPVQSIHPEGHINVNECIYCMHCQELYYDDQRCPHMIQVRLKREKFQAMSSPSMRAGGSGPKTVITHAGKPVLAPRTHKL
ncbi:4Fe-4S binding protein [Bradyrhizobium neotropicale]|uniref:4Fe-4S binding protein n=1 Tax=Bradyrhizobium neotropicale TaxID=1497615 RepID=UPI001AD62BA4|nr:4Fe-4S binding protein [Bradyrhizobium neotropicale]MBO4221588.1 4Fe-4S binding protein [Bradyrhizobium neotropicale]